MSAPRKGWVSSHVLDTGIGRPAEGIPVEIAFKATKGSVWKTVGKSTTDEDGRVKSLLHCLEVGTYRITFYLQPYYESKRMAAFYPEATICFCVADASDHFHIPLLISDFGYTTYRGS